MAMDAPFYRHWDNTDVDPELGTVLAVVDQLHLHRSPQLQSTADLLQLVRIRLRPSQETGDLANRLVPAIPRHSRKRLVDVQDGRTG